MRHAGNAYLCRTSKKAVTSSLPFAASRSGLGASSPWGWAWTSTSMESPLLLAAPLSRFRLPAAARWALGGLLLPGMLAPLASSGEGCAMLAGWLVVERLLLLLLLLMRAAPRRDTRLQRADWCDSKTFSSRPRGRSVYMHQGAVQSRGRAPRLQIRQRLHWEAMLRMGFSAGMFCCKGKGPLHDGNAVAEPCWEGRMCPGSPSTSLARDRANAREGKVHNGPHVISHAPLVLLLRRTLGLSCTGSEF